MDDVIYIGKREDYTGTAIVVQATHMADVNTAAYKSDDEDEDGTASPAFFFCFCLLTWLIDEQDVDLELNSLVTKRFVFRQKTEPKASKTKPRPQQKQKPAAAATAVTTTTTTTDTTDQDVQMDW